MNAVLPPLVITGLDPVIQPPAPRFDLDSRVKPGHDKGKSMRPRTGRVWRNGAGTAPEAGHRAGCVTPRTGAPR